MGQDDEAPEPAEQPVPKPVPRPVPVPPVTPPEPAPAAAPEPEPAPPEPEPAPPEPEPAPPEPEPAPPEPAPPEPAPPEPEPEWVSPGAEPEPEPESAPPEPEPAPLEPEPAPAPVEPEPEPPAAEPPVAEPESIPEPRPQPAAEPPPAAVPPTSAQRTVAPPAAPAPLAIKPSRSWFLAPVLLAAAALAAMAAVLGTNWTRLTATDDTSWVGPLGQGVPVTARAGERYLIYGYDPIRLPASCTVRGAQGLADVRIDSERRRFERATVEDSEGETLRWLGAFGAPFTGPAVLTCEQIDAEAWVYADRSVLLRVGLAGLATFGALAVATGLAVLIGVLRTRDRRRQLVGAAQPPIPPS